MQDVDDNYLNNQILNKNVFNSSIDRKELINNHEKLKQSIKYSYQPRNSVTIPIFNTIINNLKTGTETDQNNTEQDNRGLNLTQQTITEVTSCFSDYKDSQNQLS